MSVSHITIVAHTKNPVTDGPSPGPSYTAKISPESFTHSMSVTFNEENVANSAVDTYQFKGYGKETCNFTLILDGTKHANKTGQTVQQQLTELNNIIYKYQGNLHKPFFTEVRWKDFSFYCNCETFKVNYTLFKSDGTPLMAEVELAFIVLRDPQKAILEGNTASPDMTHVHTFKEGDKLTNMCKDIYDDSSYYIQIAKLNKLSNFRNISPGTRLVFPPLINE
ncbi:hypothetical protein N9231_05445 [Saprospiraceae bacterium]|nr:hypothetical protein [Saprospiraceae bacterium]